MPVTVLKVRFESSLYQYRTLPSAAKLMIRNEGVRGFFAGYGATAIRDAPYAGLYVLFYEGGEGLVESCFYGGREGEGEGGEGGWCWC